MSSKKEYYLKNPCRATSIPYWKTAVFSVPDHMKILHDDEFYAAMLEQYKDEVYFRLKHDLQNLKPAVIPDGFSLHDASFEEYAGHINSCYGTIITAEEVRGLTERTVYCSELWLALMDDTEGKLAATGIAELDREIGEGSLEWIQVSEEYRGRGLGSYLVLELLQRMKGKAQFATVSGQCNNKTNPERLYRRCGFTGQDIWHVLKQK